MNYVQIVHQAFSKSGHFYSYSCGFVNYQSSWDFISSKGSRNRSFRSKLLVCNITAWRQIDPGFLKLGQIVCRQNYVFYHLCSHCISLSFRLILLMCYYLFPGYEWALPIFSVDCFTSCLRLSSSSVWLLMFTPSVQ